MKELIYRLIETSMDDVIKDTIELVNIKSVQDIPCDGAPFGIGPRAVLDRFVRMSESEGFYVTDYGCGIVSAALYEGKPDIGIWLHGDVVPEGDGWNFSPYDAKLHNGCIIGRGATDNKGQLAGIFNLFKIFKKSGYKFKYNPAIYVGSNEETGMEDLREFLKSNTPPTLSLVPDNDFPVAQGGKGSVYIKLKSKNSLKNFTFRAGTKDAPGKAEAFFDASDIDLNLLDCEIKKGEKTVISASSPLIHPSNPSPDGNMITKLSSALIESNIISDEEIEILKFIKTLSYDINGKFLNIYHDSSTMGKLTVFAKSVETIDGYPEITLNIRNPIEISYNEIVDKITEISAKNGFSVTEAKLSVNSYLHDSENPIFKMLLETANRINKKEEAPLIMKGATYANNLPNAYAFGTSCNKPPEDFENGRGYAHGTDEALSLSQLEKAMKIYAEVLMNLN